MGRSDTAQSSPTQKPRELDAYEGNHPMPCACGNDKRGFAGAYYLRALLEAGEEDLTEGGGVVKVSCDNCGYVMLFDAEKLGIRGLWDQRRNL
jgi:hypothetical protein